jgi:ABC-type proline/glycine betaine transport system ATPase subunit
LQELKKNYTIILVPHSVQQAARTADYAAFFLQGELIEYDDGKKMFTTPKEKKTEDYIMGGLGKKHLRIQTKKTALAAVFFHPHHSSLHFTTPVPNSGSRPPCAPPSPCRSTRREPSRAPRPT